MILNDQNYLLRKFHSIDQLNQTDKFKQKNKIKYSQKYLHKILPYEQEYINKKIKIYNKYRSKQNKQNCVYNLSQNRMLKGFYLMKGCKVQENQQKNHKIAIKTLIPTLQNKKQQKPQFNAQKNVTSFLKKYLQRKQKYKQKSQRSLSIVLQQVKNNPLNNISSQRTIRISSRNGKQRILKSQVQTKQTTCPDENIQSIQKNELLNLYRKKVQSRKRRMKTVQ